MGLKYTICRVRAHYMNMYKYIYIYRRYMGTKVSVELILNAMNGE